MAHFAHITKGIVDSVIVISRDTLTQANGWYCPGCGTHKPLEEWVQTSYNVQAGEYKGDTVAKTALLAEKEKAVLSLNAEEAKRVGGDEDMKARNRKHYAGIGYSYDSVNDRFIPPQPFKSWVLDEKTTTWQSPKPYPKLGGKERYDWNEELLDWVISK